MLFGFGITFDFNPQIVFVYLSSFGITPYGTLSYGNTGWYNSIVCVPNQSRLYNYGNSLTVSFVGNILTWYSVSGNTSQLNELPQVYKYLAIG